MTKIQTQGKKTPALRDANANANANATHLVVVRQNPLDRDASPEKPDHAATPPLAGEPCAFYNLLCPAQRRYVAATRRVDMGVRRGIH